MSKLSAPQYNVDRYNYRRDLFIPLILFEMAFNSMIRKMRTISPNRPKSEKIGI